MEAAGLAVGLCALIGTFKDCIDLFSLINTARTIERDYAILATKLDIEKTILLQWAKRVRLLRYDYDRRLDNEEAGKPIAAILAQIQSLLSQSGSLQIRYGPSQAAGPENSSIAVSNLVGARRYKSFVEDFKKLSLQTGGKFDTSFRQKARWAIKDKDQFEILVQNLAYFVGKLNQIIPESPSMTTKAFQEDFNSVTSIEELKLVTDVMSEEMPEVSEAAKERVNRILQQKILSRLYFPEMTSRQSAIAPQHRKTFNWALEHSSSGTETCDFLEWLRSGSGIYWLRGKAGSGKSTLMKFLYEDPRTWSHLQAWTGGEECHHACYFFWRLGTDEQKSQTGLFRALLWQILRSEPSLSQHLLPRMWEDASSQDSDNLNLPTIQEMKAMPGNLFKFRGFSKICIFIDGLDELSGNHSESIEFIKELAACPDLKIIVSSRPEPAFVAAFESLPYLRLEHLTKRDIEAYVQDKIVDHPYVKRIVELEPEETKNLLSGLVDKAMGVFLWVVLACRSLVNGFEAYDSAAELMARMEELPPELEDLFQHMLMKVETRYRPQAAKLLKICHQHQAGQFRGAIPLCAVGLALLDGHKFDTSKISDTLLYSVEDKVAKCAFFEGRLRSRTGGLLELRREQRWCSCQLAGSTQHYDNDPHYTVEFMHRSVFEFLDGDKVPNLECLSTGEEFDPNAALACYSLHMFRLCPPSRVMTNMHLERSTMELLLYASRTEYESANQIIPVMLRFEEKVDRVQEDGDTFFLRNHFIEGSSRDIVLRLAVEAGVTAYVERYALISNSASSSTHPTRRPLPLLFHANMRWLMKNFVHADVITKFPLEHRMIHLLLEIGCDPNEQFCMSEQVTTPWAIWLKELKSNIRHVAPNFTRDGNITMAFLSHREFELDGLDRVLEWAQTFVPDSPLYGDEWKAFMALKNSIVGCINSRRLSNKEGQLQSGDSSAATSSRPSKHLKKREHTESSPRSSKRRRGRF